MGLLNVARLAGESFEDFSAIAQKLDGAKVAHQVRQTVFQDGGAVFA
jgi:hypothetical protein